jgi:hypothetical protein
MRASNVGLAWMLGGYPGSKDLAIAMLNKVPCQELSISWVLVEPNGPRSLPESILLSFGASMSSDFEVVGSFMTPAGAGGHNEAHLQKLLRPIRSVDSAFRTCLAIRKTRQ